MRSRLAVSSKGQFATITVLFSAASIGAGVPIGAATITKNATIGKVPNPVKLCLAILIYFT